MGQRIVRVNELLKREISRVLHSRYQQEAVSITILDVETAPNLRQAKVFFSAVGDERVREQAERFLQRKRVEIQQAVGSVVVLKFLPQLEFIYDPSVERGARLNALLDELDLGDPLPGDSGELPPDSKL